LIVLSVIVYVLRQNCRAAGWRWDTNDNDNDNDNDNNKKSLSNHNDFFCPILDSPNTIQTNIHNLDLSYNDIHVINQNFYYHQNFKEQIENEFNRTLNE
jgi:hypothetical protein